MIEEAQQPRSALTAPSRAHVARFGVYSAFAGVAVGAFVGPLDGSMVTSMVPVLTQELDVDVSTIGWLLTIYMLIQTGLMLSFGRLGDLYGHKPVYVGGLIVFMLGTALSSFAATPALLIGARAVTALGSAAIWANSAAILTHAVPRERRGRVLGLQSMMVQLGNSLGPPLGGLVAGLLGWRAIFWVSIPVTLVALALSLRFIERDQPSGRRQRFDVAGAGLYMLGLMAVLVALNQGHAWGWGSFGVIGSLMLGLALLAGFVALERRLTSPMLDLRLFRQRAFAAPVVTAVFNFICAGSIVFLVPIYLLLGRGLTPAEAGLILVTKPLVMCSITILSGSLSDKIGSRIPATLGNMLGLGLAGAIFATVLAGHALTDQGFVIQAVNAAFATTSALAVVGAMTAASRPATPR